MQQFCNSCDEYRDVVIDSDCTSCVWHKAVADTEERIIKLLEEQKAIECKKAVCETIFDGHDYECLSEVIDCYIALIKGEK